MTPPAQDRLRAIAKELRSIVNGFKNEALNGVICVPSDDADGSPQWSAPPSRQWCVRCKTRWERLFKLADSFDAAVPPREPPWEAWRVDKDQFTTACGCVTRVQTVHLLTPCKEHREQMAAPVVPSTQEPQP